MSPRPDDWSRVRETFEGALALPSDARPAYLSKTCGGDDALRQQVEALLASHERAKNFLETPVVPPLSDALETTRLEGRRLGPYQLAARIGTGGMGEVYRARDTKLGRDVAIKVLPAPYGARPGRARTLRARGDSRIIQLPVGRRASGFVLWDITVLERILWPAPPTTRARRVCYPPRCHSRMRRRFV